MNTNDRDEIARLTNECGGTWGINHVWRLLKLVELLARNEPYEREVVWLAAHLHDWGAYKPWAQTGVDHVRRSVEVAGLVLAGYDCSEAVRRHILECIAHHASPGTERGISREAMLLHDADVLDFLGAVGILRDFSKNPRDLRAAYNTVLKRREELPRTLFLRESEEIALSRLRQMDELLAAFEAGSFGCF